MKNNEMPEWTSLEDWCHKIRVLKKVILSSVKLLFSTKGNRFPASKLDFILPQEEQ